jgi:hypothetical protein
MWMKHTGIQNSVLHTDQGKSDDQQTGHSEAGFKGLPLSGTVVNYTYHLN